MIPLIFPKVPQSSLGILIIVPLEHPTTVSRFEQTNNDELGFKNWIGCCCHHTVDGNHLNLVNSPVDMVDIPLFAGFHTCQVQAPGPESVPPRTFSRETYLP